MVDVTSALTFALILPLFQLALFGFVLFQGIKFYHSIAFTVIELVETLGTALVEERQSYRRIIELIDQLEEHKKWQETKITQTSTQE